MRNGGGIGDSIPRLSYKYTDGLVYSKKVAFEHSFYFFINLILINLVLGVIVDTFNELRGQDNIRDEDKENKC